MKIAVATDKAMVAEHFGRCPEYTLVSVREGEAQASTVIPNPGHQPGFLPEYLAKLGVTHIIAGGMGPRAEQLFTAQGITTVVGASGPVDEVVAAYLAGKLATGATACHHEEGQGHTCQDHHLNDH